jgi:hypothetical protein
MTAIASIVMTKAPESAIWATCPHPRAVVALDGMWIEHRVVSTLQVTAQSVIDKNP